MHPFAKLAAEVARTAAWVNETVEMAEWVAGPADRLPNPPSGRTTPRPATRDEVRFQFGMAVYFAAWCIISDALCRESRAQIGKGKMFQSALKNGLSLTSPHRWCRTFHCRFLMSSCR